MKGVEGHGGVRMRNSEPERVVRVEGIGRGGSGEEGVGMKIREVINKLEDDW